MRIPLSPTRSNAANDDRSEIIFDEGMQEYRLLTFDRKRQETTSSPLPEKLQAKLRTESLAAEWPLTHEDMVCLSLTDEAEKPKECLILQSTNRAVKEGRSSIICVRQPKRYSDVK